MIWEMKPIQLASEWVKKTRATGYTTELIKNLPRDKKYAVISFSNVAATVLEKRVKEVRGTEVCNNGTFVSLENIDLLKGLSLARIYVDNCALGVKILEWVVELNQECTDDDKKEEERLQHALK